MAVIFLIGWIVVVPTSAMAALSMRVMPVDGGDTLRFGRVSGPNDFNKEIRFRITSTDGKQYQVFQRLVEPFINERGEQLNRQVLVSSALSGSNAAGTLFIQDIERIGFADQLVYTSSPDGINDSFTMIYQINSDEVSQSGDFNAKMLFTVRAVGEGTQDESVVNVFFNAEDNASIDFESSSGKDYVRIETSSEDKMSGYTRIKFSGYPNEDVKIYQELRRVPLNEEGQRINEDVLQFSVQSDGDGSSLYQEPSRFARAQQLIFETSASEGDVFVEYVLDEDYESSQKAGLYNGQIRLTVDNGLKQDITDIDIDLAIDPVFEIETQYPDGGVSFSRVVANAEAQEKEVLIRIKSNLAKPYILTQTVQSPLTNEEGDQFDKSFFLIKQASDSTINGELENTEYIEVQEGDTTLYVSDALGSSVEFRVIYKLQPYQNMKPGNYRAAIVYSLSEI